MVVKIISYVGLGIGQVGKNGPLTPFERLRFEAGLEAFGLGIAVAAAAATLRTHSPVLVQQGPVGIAAALAAAVGVDHEFRGGRLS